MKDFPLDTTDLRWLGGVARALLGESHAAEDLVQDTVVAAMEGPPDSREVRRAWLSSVARNLAARRFRSHARREAREESAAHPEALPSTVDLVERAEVAEKVTAALRALPEPYRRTLLLRFLEGLSPEEIARQEGKSADTVRWRQRRGLELLRDDLVRHSDREWSSWCALLLPLTRLDRGTRLATAGSLGASLGKVATVMSMKLTMGIAVALVACVSGLWLTRTPRDAEPELTIAQMEEASSLEAERVADTESDRVASPLQARTPIDAQVSSPAAAPPPELPPTHLTGVVLGQFGEPVPNATVYLVAPASSSESDSMPVLTQTETDREGRFRLTRQEFSADELAELDLGVHANGYLRRVLPLPAELIHRVADDPEPQITLDPGRRLKGRVLEANGTPVPGLQVLVHTAYAKIPHVSPSQMQLRSEKARLGDANSTYQQALEVTDALGEVEWSGLPDGALEVRSLDAGWELEDHATVEADGQYVTWTAVPRLGVKLLVRDADTGRPVEKVSATFCVTLVFEDGEEVDYEQWLGRGRGSVSCILSSQEFPGLYERGVEKATFYGGVKVDGRVQKWRSEPWVRATSPRTLTEVQVLFEAEEEEEPTAASEDPVEAPSAPLTLDVRYEDGGVFEGGLSLNWAKSPEPLPQDIRSAYPDRIAPGRYRIELAEGEVFLEASDRLRSGSLPTWRGSARLKRDSGATVQVTLIRGAVATLRRPAGWNGNWSVRATWRTDDSEDWQGGLGYGTEESELYLSSLRPAEWRFELSQGEDPEFEPVVLLVPLEAGDNVVLKP